MRSKLLNPMLWLCVSFLCTAPAFGGSQVAGGCCPKSCAPCCPSKNAPFDQGYELCPNNMMGAYNAPGRIDVCCSCDFFIDASFIYWYASEEGLELSLSDTTANGLPIVDGKITDIDFKYRPGFKVGLGYNSCHDDWQFYLQYTWLHFTDTISTKAPQPSPPGVLYPLQSHPANSTNLSILEANGKWDVDIDLLDFEMARPYYVGTMLIFRPFVGLRAQWIDQNLTSNYQVFTSTLLEFFKVKQRSESWAVGPRCGLDTNWILGCGFRLIGNVAGSIVYTRYTTIKYNEENATDPTLTAVDVTDEYGTLRPVLEFQSGIGYGLYFCRNSYHFDIAATYDFQNYWNQNQFRLFVDNAQVAKSKTRLNDLYLHGLTLKVRFDF